MRDTQDSLTERIKQRAKDLNAVILAHNYTLPEVQDLADFVGDSLELALRVANIQAEVIVFCGVHFMAETAKIINPNKKVLMPDLRAGCPMADMITAEALRHAKDEVPQSLVVSYVNTSAAVKAESDICCTSSNAVAVVNGMPTERPILFVPDRNLGAWVSCVTGRTMKLWNGYCPTHERILPEFVQRTKQQHPQALFVAHPECSPTTLAFADHIASTAGILHFCRESTASEFILGTEVGLIYRLRREHPDKSFIEAAPRMTCPNMKTTNPVKILKCLEALSGEITVEQDIAERAHGAITKMLEYRPNTDCKK